MFEKPRPRTGRASARALTRSRPSRPTRWTELKRGGPLRPGLLGRPPGGLSCDPQPGADRPRGRGDALVAARLRPHLETSEARPPPQPDGLQGRHANIRAEDTDAMRRFVWLGGRRGRPGWRAAPTWSPAGSGCCSRSGTAPRSKTRSRRSAATSTAAPRSAARTSSIRSTSTRNGGGKPVIPVDAHVRLASRRSTR